MNERIQFLRNTSLEAVNRISVERARLITQFYKKENNPSDPVPVQRAKAFQYILEHKSICILPGELIVGERGPEPKATPTYPEVSLHSIADLEMLDSRPKVSFKVSESDKEIYRNEIIPFWKGRNNREKIMQAMSQEWLDAYAAGVFTEFQEQRAPGHTVAGKKLFTKGLLDLIDETEALKNESADPEKLAEWDAMQISARAMIRFADRHAEKLMEQAAEESNPVRVDELIEMARICKKVPAHAPETFHEALQHYWFVHIGVITELNPWDSFNPGRLDQHLWPFFTAGMKNNTLSTESARELLQAFWVKFNNHPAPPKVGVTAKESNTYTDFALINLGGLTEEGLDAVNDLSFLILDVIEEMRILQPSSMVQISRKNPDAFIDRALKITKTGFGQPSFFNTDAIVQELLNQGKSITDARNGGASGCVETGAFGTERYTLTGYFNFAKILELTLHNGYDPRTKKQIGLRTGELDRFKSYAEFVEAFRKQLTFFAQIKIEGNKRIQKLFADNLPAPFLSLIIDDCISNGKDYNCGGARYNTTYIQGVGLGTTSDSLAAIKQHLFDKQSFSANELLQSLNKDFSNNTELHFKLLYESPKYGNDDEAADDRAREIFQIFYEAVNGQPDAIGGVHRINLLPTTSHIYFGSVCGALPDGRKKGQPLSEGISPVQGMDTHGPTAVLKSASKIDHLHTGGTLLNQKFTPEFFEDERAIEKIRFLIRTYFKLNGHHIQFNVVSADTLRDAQKHPEKYRDLIVRVAGYSDYFNDLGTDLQNEIIRRTEQDL